jgi:hypothetical protein
MGGARRGRKRRSAARGSCSCDPARDATASLLSWKRYAVLAYRHGDLARFGFFRLG